MDWPFSHYIIFCLSLSSNNSYNLLNASYVPDTILSKYYLLFMYNGIVLKLLNRFYFFINFFFNFFHINPCLFYFIFYFFPIIFISWRLITLQYCSGFCHTLTGISHGFTCVPHPGPPLPPSSPSHPSGSSQCTSPKHLSHASSLDWRSVSHLIIYMLQCCSLRSSHPHLLPQSPKVCSIHLCLFFCLAYKVIITIFLNSIFVH